MDDSHGHAGVPPDLARERLERKHIAAVMGDQRPLALAAHAHQAGWQWTHAEQSARGRQQNRRGSGKPPNRSSSLKHSFRLCTCADSDVLELTPVPIAPAEAAGAMPRVRARYSMMMSSAVFPDGIIGRTCST